MFLSLLFFLGISHAGVEPVAYSKHLHCGFKVKDEKHSFYIYSHPHGGPMWVAFREALYSSYLPEIEDPREIKKVPMSFEFRVGALADGEWQAHIVVSLEKIEEKNNKQVCSGKIAITNLDGKMFSAPIRCR